MASVLDSLIIKLVGDVTGLRAELQKAPALARAAGKETADAFNRGGTDVRRTTAELDRVGGALDRVERDVRDVNQEFRRGERDAGGFRRSLGRIGTDLRTLGGNIGFLVGSGGIVYGLQQAATAAQRAEVGTRLFQNQVRRTGQDVGDATRTIDALADRLGVVPETIQDSVTQLLRQGLTIGEISQTFEGAAASALATGRTTAEGIDAVTQAIVNQSSIYLNYAGIAENLDVAYKEYARTLGKSVDELTKQEKAQAAVALVTRATKEEVADLDTLLGGLTGAQNELNKELKDAQIAFGNVVREGLTPIYGAAADVLGIFNQLPGPTKAALGAFAVGAGGATALAAALGTLALVLGPLAGPAGLLILAAGGVTALIAAFGARQSDIERTNEALDKTREIIGTAGGKQALVGSLDTLADKLEGDAKRAVEAFRAEIQAAGGDLDDLKAKTQAFINDIQVAPLIAKRDALQASIDALSADANAAGDATAAQAELTRLRAEGNDALDRGETLPIETVRRIQFLETVVERGPESGDALTRTQQLASIEIARLYEELNRVNREISAVQGSAPASTTPGDPPLAPDPTGTGTSDVRTIQEVFADVDAAALAANRRAEVLGNTLEARLEAAEARASALSSALDEALDPDTVGTTPQHLADLAARLGDVTTQASALEDQLRLTGVFDDLGRAGTNAEREAAALGGTLDASLDSVRERIGEVGTALRDALDLGAPAEQIDYLVSRLGDLEAEARNLEARKLFQDIAQQGARIDARVRADIEAGVNPAEARLSGLQEKEGLFQRAQGTLINDLGRPADDPELQYVSSKIVEFGDQIDNLTRRIAQSLDVEAIRREATQRLSRGETAPDPTAFPLPTRGQAELLERFGPRTREPVPTTPIVLAPTEPSAALPQDSINPTRLAPGLPRIGGELEAAEERLAEVLTRLAPDFLIAARAGKKYRELLEGVLVLEPTAPLPVPTFPGIAPDEYPVPAFGVDPNAQPEILPTTVEVRILGEDLRRALQTLTLGTALDARGRGLTPTDFQNAAAQGILMTGPDGVDQDFIDNFTRATDNSAEQQEAAAEQFAQTVVQSGVQFASALIQGIRTGDIGGILSGGGSAIGSILSSINPLLGTLISGGLGIIGSLISGGQDDKRDERSRAAERLNRQGPTALEINATFNQTNAFQGALTDPAVGVALREQNSQFMREFEKLLARTIIPRLDRLEEVSL